MTVREYLGILNNCSISNGMDMKLIDFTGFIDVIPSNGDIEVFGHSAVNLEKVEDDKLFVKMSYYTDIGDLPCSKVTTLDDPLEIHCTNGLSEIEMIKRTISALKEIVETQKRSGFGPSRIPYEIIIKNFEEYVFNNENNMKNGL